MIGMGIKTDSKILLKLGSKIGVNIDSGIWTGSQFWESESYSWLNYLPICQYDSKKLYNDQVPDVNHKRWVIQFHDEWA